MAEEVSNLGKDGGGDARFCAPSTPHLQAGRLEAAISQALETLQWTPSARTASGEPGGGNGPARPIFDAEQLHRVSSNLFKNAMEAMPRGGEITVTTRVRGGNVEVVLADTGEGIPPEVAANIFQPYFTTKAKGTGLGLAICQGIIQEHGGSISVASTRAKAPLSPSACPCRHPLRIESLGDVAGWL